MKRQFKKKLSTAKVTKIIFFLLFSIFMPIQTIEKHKNILVFTLQKTGTNLVLKLLRMVYKQQHQNVGSLGKDNNKCIYWGHLHVTPTSIIGIEPTWEKIEDLKKYNIKLILLLRDPRQHVISLLRTLNISLNHNSIEWGIKNFPLMLEKHSQRKHYRNYKDINDCYKKYLQWADEYPNVYITSFENLVGPRGGGSAQAQYEEIKQLLAFLDIKKSDNEIKVLAQNLFGGTPTFKEGQSATWKQYYSKANKELFKTTTKQLLIDLGYEQDHTW